MLGSATWMEGGHTRRALVAPLPGEPDRWVDLNRVEAVRLAKLGEGRAEELADALVPADLLRILEGGTRALQRVAVTLAYAEKWHGRNGLPEALAPRREQVRLLPCLPRPAALRRYEGTRLDHLLVGGPGATLHVPPRPTLAVVGLHGNRVAGCCLALEDDAGAVLGTWLSLGGLPEGELTLRHGREERCFDLAMWHGLELPRLRAGEVLLLPPPEGHPLVTLTPGGRFELGCPFDQLQLRLARQAQHPTVQ